MYWRPGSFSFCMRFTACGHNALGQPAKSKSHSHRRCLQHLLRPAWSTSTCNSSTYGLKTEVQNPWNSPTQARVTLPSSLQSLTFGDFFCDSLQDVLWCGVKVIANDKFSATVSKIVPICRFRSCSLPVCCIWHLDARTEVWKVLFCRKAFRPWSLETCPPFFFARNVVIFGEKLRVSGQFHKLWHVFRFLCVLIFCFTELFSCPSVWSLWGDAYNQTLDLFLPSSLQSLTFGRAFNQALDDLPLMGLQSLTLGDRFNMCMDQLKLPNLVELNFGHSFNWSLRKVTFPSLRKLTFGSSFNQPLDDMIMTFPALESLILGEDFNQQLTNVKFPYRLMTLTFGNRFNQSLEAVQFPTRLRYLSFGDDFVQSLESQQKNQTFRFEQNYKYMI